MSFLMQAFDMYGAEAGIEPSSLLLKIKEIFKFENFCTSMCTLTGLPMVRLERSGAPRRRKYPGCFFRSSWNLVKLHGAIFGAGSKIRIWRPTH